MALLLVFALSLPWTHPWILTSLARAWIVDDTPAHVDAVIVLAGNPDERPFHAAALYKAKRARLILVSNVESDRTVRLNFRPSDTTVADAILAHENIPSVAIDHFGKDSTSTRDEASGLRDWLVNHRPASGHTSTIAIATDPFHTRRARWIFRRSLKGLPVAFHATAVPLKYSASDWWRHEEGLIAFQNELIKALFYWFKY